MQEALNSESTWIIYPNPATKSFTLKSRNGAAGRKGKFLLYNSTGQLVRETEFVNEPQFVIDRNNLPAGLYRYTVQTSGKEPLTGKIILN